MPSAFLAQYRGNTESMFIGNIHFIYLYKALRNCTINQIHVNSVRFDINLINRLMQVLAFPLNVSKTYFYEAQTKVYFIKKINSHKCFLVTSFYSHANSQRSPNFSHLETYFVDTLFIDIGYPVSVPGHTFLPRGIL